MRLSPKELEKYKENVRDQINDPGKYDIKSNTQLMATLTSTMKNYRSAVREGKFDRQDYKDLRQCTIDELNKKVAEKKLDRIYLRMFESDTKPLI